MAPDPAYNVSEFVYDPPSHSYTCPQGQTLRTNGNWYRKERKSARRKNAQGVLVQHFKTPACKTCPVLHLCTKNTRGRGRVIERTEHQDYIDQNRRNIDLHKPLYKQRQAIIEHNYGTIKRQWNFHFVLTKKGMERAASDAGFMFVAYDLRRLMNLIDKNKFKEYLAKLVCLVFGKSSQWEAPGPLLRHLPTRIQFYLLKKRAALDII